MSWPGSSTNTASRYEFLYPTRRRSIERPTTLTPVTQARVQRTGTGSKARGGSTYKTEVQGTMAERPSPSEFERFESLVKRIVRVPKKEIDAARKREAAKKRS